MSRFLPSVYYVLLGFLCSSRYWVPSVTICDGGDSYCDVEGRCWDSGGVRHETECWGESKWGDNAMQDGDSHCASFVSSSCLFFFSLIFFTASCSTSIFFQWQPIDFNLLARQKSQENVTGWRTAEQTCTSCDISGDTDSLRTEVLPVTLSSVTIRVSIEMQKVPNISCCCFFLKSCL